MTDLELSRRERKKEETRAKIFKCACKLFRDKGFEATTIDEIAEKADVAKGTFFNYFPRKEEVLGFLSEMWIKEAEEKTAAILEDSGPALAKIRDMFVEFASFYEEDPKLAQYLTLDAHRRFHDNRDDFCRRWDDLGVKLIRHLQATGEIRRDVTPERGHEIMAAVYHDTLMRWAMVEQKPFALKEELRIRLDIAVAGLAACEKGTH
ncbi:MAG: TetR/AcrR family transcriptional regulator [Gemmatimonadetes bacterium]|nr:TetR/AcrR family transcriptional regulator [Gemmatimonadota bacterium]